MHANGMFFPVRALLKVLFVCFGPLVLTTSKKLRGLGGFPELQIPRFQKHEFLLSKMPSQCGISALVLFQASILKVTAIPDKFEQSEFQKCEI